MAAQNCICIDGTTGAGKTTLGRWLAWSLSYEYLETGLMYRSLAVAATIAQAGITETEILEVARSMQTEFYVPSAENDQIRTWLNGVEVTHLLWQADIEKVVSHVSAFPGIREIFTSRQREISRKGEVVLVGRDTGTCIAPEAKIKFYLDASPNTRAKRRGLELERLTGKPVDLTRIKAELMKRDLQDSTRTVSPLAKANDAIYIDTSLLDVKAVRTIASIHIEKITSADKRFSS